METAPPRGGPAAAPRARTLLAGYKAVAIQGGSASAAPHGQSALARLRPGGESVSCGNWPAPEPGCEAVCFLELPADPAAVRWARRQVKVASRTWQLPESTIDIVELAVSELITNAIRASEPGRLPLGSPGAEAADAIRLTLRHAPGRLVIEVFDACQDPPVLAAADPEAESGRGLMLIQALSKEWSYFLLPSGGKVVYCVLNA